MQNRWDTVIASVTRHAHESGVRLTTFAVQATKADGCRAAQKVQVDTERLERYPHLYGQILDRIVWDLEHKYECVR